MFTLQYRLTLLTIYLISNRTRKRVYHNPINTIYLIFLLFFDLDRCCSIKRHLVFKCHNNLHHSYDNRFNYCLKHVDSRIKREHICVWSKPHHLCGYIRSCADSNYSNWICGSQSMFHFIILLNLIYTHSINIKVCINLTSFCMYTFCVSSLYLSLYILHYRKIRYISEYANIPTSYGYVWLVCS